MDVIDEILLFVADRRVVDVEVLERLPVEKLYGRYYLKLVALLNQKREILAQ
jgi:hypothetical protein